MAGKKTPKTIKTLSELVRDPTPQALQNCQIVSHMILQRLGRGQPKQALAAHGCEAPSMCLGCLATPGMPSSRGTPIRAAPNRTCNKFVVFANWFLRAGFCKLIAAFFGPEHRFPLLQHIMLAGPERKPIKLSLWEKSTQNHRARFCKLVFANWFQLFSGPKTDFPYWNTSCSPARNENPAS